MTRCLAHRGPDAWHVFVNGPVAVGHTRLAIIDLTDTGSQPMHSSDGRFSIVFNGEITNFRKLRRELETSGYCFRSTSDTEVILAAYDR